MIGKLRLLFWIGIIVLFLPYIGLPSTPKTLFTILLGVAIIVISYRLKKAYKALKYKLRQVDKDSVSQVTIETNHDRTE